MQLVSWHQQIMIIYLSYVPFQGSPYQAVTGKIYRFKQQF